MRPRLREIPELRVLAWGLGAAGVAFASVVVATGVLTALPIDRRTTQGIAEAITCPAMLLALLGGLLVVSAGVMAMARTGRALRRRAAPDETPPSRAPRGPYRSSAEESPGPDPIASGDRRLALRLAVLGAIGLAIGVGLMAALPGAQPSWVGRAGQLRAIAALLAAAGALLGVGAVLLAWRSRRRS